MRKAADPAAKPIGAVNSIAAPVVAADGTATLHVGEIKTTTVKALSFAQYVQSILIVFVMMIFTTVVYGPIAAFLVEMFPLFATAYMAYTGNI